MHIVKIKIEKVGELYIGTANVAGLTISDEGDSSEEVRTYLINQLLDTDEISENNYKIEDTLDK